jgi:hypothetical protein
MALAPDTAVARTDVDLGADGFSAAIARSEPTGKDYTGLRDDHAERVRNWYILAINHPLWQKYIPAAREDEGYYIGGDLQWSKDGSLEGLNRLREKRRTTVSINHIQAVVDVLVGFERQNRFDLKASPQGDEDIESARILSWLLKFVQDQAEIQEYESEVFEDGLIRGASALHIKIRWDGDDIDGDIEVEKLTPGEDCLWDPYFKRRDLSDARFVQKFRWAYVDEVVAQYPEHEAQIDAELAPLNALFMPMLSNVSTDGGRGDAYGSVSAPSLDRLREEELFYDARDKRVLLVETWYRHYEVVWKVVNRSTGQVEDMASQQDAKDLAKADPSGNLTAVRRTLRKIRHSLVLPATFSTLFEEPSEHENDDEAYPIVPFIAKKKREWMYGIVRNMKDPQLLENKRISQVVDILQRWANIRPLIPKGSVEDERGLDEHWSTSPIVYDAKKGLPSWYVPTGLEQVARGLIEIATQFKMNLREITGVNADLLGQREDTNSGIAIARRQAQGQVIATVFFDNFKSFRKIVAQRVCRRIQQSFTKEQVLRLINPDTGEAVEVRLNPQEAQDLKGEEWKNWVGAQTEGTSGQKPYILRSVEALKYDVIINEGPSTPSARATALMALLELLGRMPSILPAVVDKIINLAEVPDRAEIIERIHAIMAQSGIPTGQPPPAGGPPPAPGVAPVPGGQPPVPGGQPSVPPLPLAAPLPLPAPSVGSQPGGATASMAPAIRRGATSNAMKKTLSLASGGMPSGVAGAV